jgi:hypothetical protein
VVTTAYSFFATPETAVRLGARPVFCDIAEGSFNADVDDLLSRVGPKTAGDPSGAYVRAAHGCQRLVARPECR